MKKMNLKKGFTLIELLVVVAIIGILASVVLSSLNTARAKGADAAIKANLANIRAQAEIIYDSTGCYGDGGVGDTTCVNFVEGTCTFGTANSLFANSIVAGQVQAAATASGAAANAVCSADTVGTQVGAAWGVAVTMKADTTKSWCVDSSGASKLYSGTPAAALLVSVCQ